MCTLNTIVDLSNSAFSTKNNQPILLLLSATLVFLLPERYTKKPYSSCEDKNYLTNSIQTWKQSKYIYITISTFTSVPPSGVAVGVPLSIFKFLQPYHKVSLTKVAWYVLRVKNMHSWAPPDPWGPWDEEKLSYIHYNIRREEAKQRILKLASVFHHLPSVGPKQLCALAHLGCTREAGTS